MISQFLVSLEQSSVLRAFIPYTVCRDLGIPLAQEKQAGPSTTLEFQGLLLTQELWLSEEKLANLGVYITTRWKSRKSCSKQELESLLRVLQHVCTVISVSRAFLWQIISLLRVTKKPHHHIRLNSTFHLDLEWWQIFATHWNGKGLINAAGAKEVLLTSVCMRVWSLVKFWLVSACLGLGLTAILDCY